MKLSMEIRLGSLLVSEPTRNDVRACAIGMANLAAGFPMPVSRNETEAYAEIVRRHPCLVDLQSTCPICKREMYGNEAVWHPFDIHVMSWMFKSGDFIHNPEMTIEQLADFIASIEPADVEIQQEETCHELVAEKG